MYDWSFHEDGLYEANDFSRYWQEPGCYPFLIRIENEHESELGGFALINKEGISQEVDWNMGEFFIVGKFQKKGIILKFKTV